MARPSLPIGLSDFRELRREGKHYVDKTALVTEIIEAGPQTLLLPRPRRFGKTLGLSMLRYFLERSPEDRRPLFAGLAVSGSAAAQVHFGRYPTIFLTFKDVKALSWETCRAGLVNVIAGAYREHDYLLTEGKLRPSETAAFQALLEERATDVQLFASLRELSALLARHHEERVLLLADEYDTPIHAGYLGGYYDRVIEFFRAFLSGGLKDNRHLWKGVMTGVMRVAKESIFSGLNNLAVYSILRPEFSTAFGFTEPEVAELCRLTGDPAALGGLRDWYEGYRFGGQVIYNPWSVLCFLDSMDRRFRPYWIATSSNDLVRELLLSGPSGLRAEVEELLRGGAVDRPLEEDVVLRDLPARPDALWSFLLFSGYLRLDEVYSDERDVLRGRLSLPNREVSMALSAMAQDWLALHVGGAAEVDVLLRAILRGDAATVEGYLSRMVKSSLSFHDTGGVGPERLYHGFIVGLLLGLSPRYEVRSNRESGFGRYDVMVLPRAPGQPGVVLELKTVDEEAGETPEAALSGALQQLRERDYARELHERGAQPIHELAAVFSGKRAWVRRG